MLKLYSFILLFFSLMCFAQNDIKGPLSTKTYGIQFTDEIELANKYITIDDIKLIKLKSNSARVYYQTNISDATMWDTAHPVDIRFSPKADMVKYEIIIPPLKPNEFYRLDVSYYGTDNVFTIVRMIHDEGNENWNTQEKKWMKMFRILNMKYDDTHDNMILTYRTPIADVIAYKTELAAFNFGAPLTATQKTALVNLTTARFPNLKFPDIKSRGGNRDDNIVLYAKAIKAAASIGFAEAGLFEQYFNCMDYEGIYNFYNKYFSVYLSDASFDSHDYLAFFGKAVLKEKNQYKGDAVPNYLQFTEEDIQHKKSIALSTFPSTFTNAYTNAIVPDFGYVVYDGFRNDFRGGSLFIGANISLKPSNKNVPLQLSSLDIWQRLAIHTGVVTMPIDKGIGQREDLFANSSLMLGLSYKVFNHAYRVNVGGIVYKQVDPITKTKSFAIAPYIGISIDIEIRKWLAGTFPGFSI